MILRRTKKIVVAIVNSTAQGEKVREEEKHLADTDDESFWTSLEDDKPLILTESRIPSTIVFFLLEEESDQAFTPRLKALKPWGKAKAPSSNVGETDAMAGSSKPDFCNMNGITPSYWHMHKVLHVLQSQDHLGLSKNSQTSDL